MKIGIYSVFDSKMSVFTTPVFVTREAGALRGFQDAVNDKESSMSKHPEDYTLFHLGDFDDDTGAIDPVKPRGLCTASSLIKPEIIPGELFRKDEFKPKEKITA